jgi:hypothetical protein
VERSRRKIFLPWGSAQSVESAQFGQGNPRKSKLFFFDFLWPGLAGLGEIRINLGVGLENTRKV